MWVPQRTCWRARRPNRRAKPATGWFPSTRAALGPGLVRLGRLGAVMATRVKNVQNGQKIDIFRLSPLCSYKLWNLLLQSACHGMGQRNGGVSAAYERDYW